MPSNTTTSRAPQVFQDTLALRPVASFANGLQIGDRFYAEDEGVWYTATRDLQSSLVLQWLADVDYMAIAASAIVQYSAVSSVGVAAGQVDEAAVAGGLCNGICQNAPAIGGTAIIRTAGRSFAISDAAIGVVGASLSVGTASGAGRVKPVVVLVDVPPVTGGMQIAIAMATTGAAGVVFPVVITLAGAVPATFA